MKFSVIIPTHNNSDDLYQILQSIRAQSFTDYEIILIADKCDKQNLEAAKKSANYCGARFKAVDYGNAGLARNAGLEMAKGEYILFADDDDYFLHNYVFDMIDNLTQKNDVDVLYFGFIFGKFGYKGPFDNGGHAFGNVWSKAWKRSAIGDTRFPNVYPDDDLQFCLLMEQKPIKITAIESPIYYYNYMRPGSISANENLQYNFSKGE